MSSAFLGQSLKSRRFRRHSIATAWAVVSRASVCIRIKRPSELNPAMKPTDQMPPIAADLSVRPTIQKLPEESTVPPSTSSFEGTPSTWSNRWLQRVSPSGARRAT